MENKAIVLDKNNSFVFSNSSISSSVLDLNGVKGSVSLFVSENENVSLLIPNVNEDCELNIELKDSSILKFSVLADKPLKQFKITANVGQSSQIIGYFADFIPDQCHGEVTINLNKPYASCDWHLASLSENKDNKKFDISAYHNAPNTVAHLDNYGVCRDDGKLVFSGICQIVKGSHGSKAHQNAKIMVFDKVSNGIAKPILKIDENDIEASHAAVVGKINDEHIFYLTSRGLTIDEAKRLITLGYLKPIMIGFDDENIRKQIEGLIEGKM